MVLTSACAGPALRTSDPADDPAAPGLPSAPQTPPSSDSSASASASSPPTSDSADPQDAHRAPPATTASASAAEPSAPPPLVTTDAQIVRELERAFASDAALSTARKRVKVSCVDGKVVLSGRVPTLSARTAIENAAQQVGGVRQIDSRLVIEK